jgi:aromatic-amino-acid transaminase
MLDHDPVLTETETNQAFFSAAQIPWGYRERAAQFNTDPRADKLDVGAGVVRDMHGKALSLVTVEKVVRDLACNAASETKRGGYAPPLGEPDFRESIRRFYLGEAASTLGERSFAVQTIGGAQALRLIADCIQRLGLAEHFVVSEQSWSDHRRIIERTGLKVTSYPYLSPDGNSINFTAMCKAFRELPARSAIVLQVSCHNPTGYDLTCEQWREIFQICHERTLLPILDAAYVGFGMGVAADLYPIQLCAESGIDFFISCSCCKPFSLYNARVGALVAVTHSNEIAARLESQIRTEVQANYSSPPSFHAHVISNILSDPHLTDQWLKELENVRLMVQEKRERLVSALCERGAPASLLNLGKQTGIFAWTGFTREQCREMTERFGVYLPSNGRVCIAAIPDDAIERLAQSLVATSREHPAHQATGTA